MLYALVSVYCEWYNVCCILCTAHIWRMSLCVVYRSVLCVCWLVFTIWHALCKVVCALSGVVCV